MADKKITIAEGSDDMLSIECNGESLFYGNTWDFHVNASTFKQMFEQLKFKVEVVTLADEEEDFD